MLSIRYLTLHILVLIIQIITIMKKTKILFGSFLLITLALGGYSLFSVLANQKISPKAESASMTLSVTHAQYENDFSDDKILMGGFHNVFVGKVMTQTGTHYRLPDMNAGLETQNSVHIIENIKGELTGDVIVAQAGGIDNGKIIAMEGDVEAMTRDGSVSPLLQPGSTYILATRGDGTEGYYMLGSNQYAKKLISSNTNENDAALATLADNNPRMKSLKSAYAEETPMKEDVIRGTTHNSFQSLDTKSKAAAQSRADEAKASLAAKAQ